MAIIECSLRSGALYWHVREIFDQRFSLRPITNISYIDSPYKNCDITLFPTLPYIV